MPVEILNSEQEKKYGKFSENPSTEQLATYFWFDDQDRNVIFNHRLDYNKLGFALQLGIVRFLGTFIPPSIKIPTNVVLYVSQQLKINSDILLLYTSDKNIRNHRNEICKIYNYSDFSKQPGHFRLTRWLYTRAWISSERPSVLFDLTTARCVNKKILLPGVTVIERLIAQVRDRSSIRLCHMLKKLPSGKQCLMLEKLINIEPNSRKTGLDLLR